MITQPLRVQHLVRSLLLVLFCAVLSGTAFQTAALAKPCDEFCTGIKIYNCTRYEYKIAFELCCEDAERVTDFYLVPSNCDGAAKFDFAPCTIVGFFFSQPLPPNVCYYWDPFDCYLKIYYCN